MCLLLLLLGCLPDFPTSNNRLYPESPTHDFDQDGFTEEQGDCNDEDATVYPEASELCDSQDNDCDGLIDDDPIDATEFYLDSDNDGVGQANFTITECEAPNGYIPLVKDEEGNVIDDCDDDNRFINPLAQEICDQEDNDCDLLIDEEDDDLAGEAYWYPDSDRDLFPSPDGQVTSCTQPTGYVQGEETLPTELIDCNDSDPQINPNAPEICDSFDNDCDGLIDDADVDDPVDRIWTVDADGDGFGDNTSGADTVASCQPVEGYAAVATDCDDNNYAINPEAEEVCDEIDQNCNGQTDEGVKVLWYLDEDGDGFGADPSVMAAIQACPNSNPTGYVSNFEDCDDTDATIAPSPTWYLDGDGDGYGSPAYPIGSCMAPSGYVADAGDCDDSKGNVNPSKQEDCLTTFDDNCDGDVNSPNALSCSDFFLDADDDGFGVDGDTACICVPDDTTQYRATIGGDCDDTRNAVKPSTANAVVLEDCDTVYDDNCNGDLNETAAANCANHFLDADGDGFGTADYLCMCSVDGDYTLTYQNQVDEDNRQIDCNDGSALISPAAQEVCDDNDVDEDCSGVADDAAAPGSVNWYRDGDGDGFGTTTDILDQCDQPTGYILQDGDCDDANPALNPGEIEICVLDPLTNLHRDEDCSGSDNDPDINAYNGGTLYYADVDNDGYGITGDTHYGCYPDGIYTAVLDGDCDDGDNAINPNRAEVCATADDEDCDGTADEDGALDCTTYYKDVDNDGYGLGDDSICSCAEDGDYRASIGSDCNDGDALVNSGLGNCGLMGDIDTSTAALTIQNVRWTNPDGMVGGFDYNNDGFDDVAVANSYYDPIINGNQYLNAGALAIFLGPLDTDVDTTDLNDAHVIFTIDQPGYEIGSRGGISVGNWDADPHTEIVVSNDDGNSFLLQDGLSGLVTPSSPLVTQLNETTGNGGFGLGSYTRLLGDANGDGVMDVVSNRTLYLGQIDASTQEIDSFQHAGLSYRQGSSNLGPQHLLTDLNGDGVLEWTAVDEEAITIAQYDSSTSTWNESTIVGWDHYNMYDAYSHIASGDLNGDGIEDLVVGNESFDAFDPFVGTIPDSGGVWVFYGRTGGLDGLSWDDADWKLRGSSRNAELGDTISILDVDNDGFEDLTFGSYQDSSSSSLVHLIYGPISPTLDSQGEVDWSTETDTDARFLASGQVAYAGDQNQDGFDDVMITRGANIYLFLGQPN